MLRRPLLATTSGRHPGSRRVPTTSTLSGPVDPGLPSDHGQVTTSETVRRRAATGSPWVTSRKPSESHAPIGAVTNTGCTGCPSQVPLKALAAGGRNTRSSTDPSLRAGGSRTSASSTAVTTLSKTVTTAQAGRSRGCPVSAQRAQGTNQSTGVAITCDDHPVVEGLHALIAEGHTEPT